MKMQTYLYYSHLQQCSTQLHIKAPLWKPTPTVQFSDFGNQLQRFGFLNWAWCQFNQGTALIKSTPEHWTPTVGAEFWISFLYGAQWQDAEFNQHPGCWRLHWAFSHLEMLLRSNTDEHLMIDNYIQILHSRKCDTNVHQITPNVTAQFIKSS